MYEVKAFYTNGMNSGCHANRSLAVAAYSHVINHNKGDRTLLRCELISHHGVMTKYIAIYDLTGVEENATLQSLRRVG